MSPENSLSGPLFSVFVDVDEGAEDDAILFEEDLSRVQEIVVEEVPEEDDEALDITITSPN